MQIIPYTIHTFSIIWIFFNQIFDQIIISGNLLGKDRSTLKYIRSEVFNRDFLKQKEGKYKGYPLRTHAAGVYLNGYSDHFPTLIYLAKEIK